MVPILVGRKSQPDEVAMTERNYTHLLLAVDFAPDAEPVIERAVHLRNLYEARLSLLHVLEYAPQTVELMPMAYAGDMVLPEAFDLERQLIDAARGQLDRLGERLGVPPEDRHIQVGPTGHAIQAAADELGVDLVILGGHGRHGFRALLGSTVKSVIHGLSCDVLCVRLSEGAS
jgi:universal stress protein A